MGSRIKFMVSGSAPIAPRHLEFFSQLGWTVLEAYGVSENTIPMASNLRTRHRSGSVGIPFCQNIIRIAPDGEILVKGPGLFAGYWRENSTEDTFTNDGFYKTGDIGRLDEDGFLYLLGRKSDMIKTSTGRKIFPTAIESVYQEHPLIDKVVIFGEGRPHLVGLITINANEVCRRLGIGPAGSAARVLIRDPRLVEMIRLAVEEQGTKLPPQHRIARYTLMPERFDVATGEITANLKIRRQTIAAKFAECIDRMYDKSSSKLPVDQYEPMVECAISS
jgi:long-chain acyl-CoA synthetase